VYDAVVKLVDKILATKRADPSEWEQETNLSIAFMG